LDARRFDHRVQGVLELHADAVDAVVFDLPDVILCVTPVEIAAWRDVLDGYLEAWARRRGLDPPPPPFDPEVDSVRYMHGCPRAVGLRAFLASRGIPPERETVSSLSNRAVHVTLTYLEQSDRVVVPAARTLLCELAKVGMRTACVTTSRICQAALWMTRIGGLFDACVGREEPPEPDLYREVTRRLGVEPWRAVAVTADVWSAEAALRAGFGLVTGVERGETGALLRRGADVVVEDLSQIGATYPT
jgi:beta-phosphoglucomutase-like phosphatase (HAD superfamily)